MDISSSLTGTKEFRIVKRGYDPDEVNAFLDQIALGVGELKRKLVDAEDTAAAARQAAAATPKEAPAAGPDTQAEEIHRALILAQRAADEEVRKATEEGEALVASARHQAEELRSGTEAEVARRRDEGRAELLAEIDELEQVRDSLSNDVTVLERHVEEQREVVQAAVGELQSLLDHPEAFRIATETGVSTTPAAIDREPSAPADGPPVGASDGGRELPGKADLSEALAWAEQSGPAAPDEIPAPGPRSDGAPPPPPPPPPAGGDRPAPPPALPAEETVPITAPPPVPPGSDLFAGPPGGDDDDRELGAPTEAVATVGGSADPDEDAFLAELRKAMLDDEPLGPREDPSAAAGYDEDGGRNRPRFGRRR